MIRPPSIALVLAALAVIVLYMAVSAQRRSRKAQRELDRRARQRETVQQMVADFTEDCCVEALRHRRGISRDETSNLFALVLCIALGAFGAEVLTW